MHLVWTIVVGFVVGVIAKFIYPSKENMGLVSPAKPAASSALWSAPLRFSLSME